MVVQKVYIHKYLYTIVKERALPTFICQILIDFITDGSGQSARLVWQLFRASSCGGAGIKCIVGICRPPGCPGGQWLMLCLPKQTVNVRWRSENNSIMISLLNSGTQIFKKIYESLKCFGGFDVMCRLTFALPSTDGQSVIVYIGPLAVVLKSNVSCRYTQLIRYAIQRVVRAMLHWPERPGWTVDLCKQPTAKRVIRRTIWANSKPDL